MNDGETLACACRSERHTDSMLWSQDDHGACFDGLTRRQLKIIFSEHVAQNHEDLQHRKVSTDASSRTASEGEIGEGGEQLFVRLGKTFRVESLGVLPIVRRMMRSVNKHNDRRSAGYEDVACAIVGDGHAIDHPKRR